MYIVNINTCAARKCSTSRLTRKHDAAQRYDLKRRVASVKEFTSIAKRSQQENERFIRCIYSIYIIHT